jgi:hypothetical protein
VATKAAKAAAAARASMGPAAPEVPAPPRNMVSEWGHKFDYYLDAIPWFDARQRYKRFPGGAASAVDTPRGYAYLWRSPSGEVVARMTSQGYRIAFKVLTESGAPVLDEQI